ncbi:MAG TPA: hypothetical protein PKM65_07650 [Spirochaetota bacterium]|nr:hypothetical protein [Spirochaetota bacterium]HNT09765.1 hypothetical protein [Spirochaetota bacterium]HNV46616.1 hypothetical protein [Spirochaetota bacterium]HOS40655.1 hypothetical protein [Spirochaetota bacterium]HPI21894.1 hypothetical protein [Spirochaetota bacterium]
MIKVNLALELPHGSTPVMEGHVSIYIEDAPDPKLYYRFDSDICCHATGEERTCYGCRYYSPWFGGCTTAVETSEGKLYQMHPSMLYTLFISMFRENLDLRGEVSSLRHALIHLCSNDVQRTMA